MRPELIIELVYLVCNFVYYSFVEKDRGTARFALDEIRNLDRKL